MPKMMWVPVGDVAKAAVAGLDADRAVVIPGLANRISAAAGWLSPRVWSSPWRPAGIPRSATEVGSAPRPVRGSNGRQVLRFGRWGPVGGQAGPRM